MKLVDLSHPLVHGAPAFPNDPKLAIIAHGSVATHQYNISQVLISAELRRPRWLADSRGGDLPVTPAPLPMEFLFPTPSPEPEVRHAA